MKENFNENDFEKHNSKKESLTIESFKKLTGLNSISDAKAEETILAIKCLVEILLSYESEEDQINNNEEEYNLKQAA